MSRSRARSIAAGRGGGWTGSVTRPKEIGGPGCGQSGLKRGGGAFGGWSYRVIRYERIRIRMVQSQPMDGSEASRRRRALRAIRSRIKLLSDATIHAAARLFAVLDRVVPAPGELGREWNPHGACG